jgi:hypothetical protein
VCGVPALLTDATEKLLADERFSELPRASASADVGKRIFALRAMMSTCVERPEAFNVPVQSNAALETSSVSAEDISHQPPPTDGDATETEEPESKPGGRGDTRQVTYTVRWPDLQSGTLRIYAPLRRLLPEAESNFGIIFVEGSETSGSTFPAEVRVKERLIVGGGIGLWFKRHEIQVGERIVVRRCEGYDDRFVIRRTRKIDGATRLEGERVRSIAEALKAATETGLSLEDLAIKAFESWEGTMSFETLYDLVSWQRPVSVSHLRRILGAPGFHKNKRQWTFNTEEYSMGYLAEKSRADREKQRADTLTGEVRDLLSRRQQQEAAAANQLVSLQCERDELRQRVDDLETELRALNCNMELRRADSERLANDLQTEKSARREAETRQQELEAKITLLTTEVSELGSRCESLQHENSNLKAELNRPLVRFVVKLSRRRRK